VKPFDANTLAHEARIASLESQLAEAIKRIRKLEAAKRKAKIMPLLSAEEHKARIRIGQITAEVATQYGVTVERLRSHDRRQVFQTPRRDAWARCHAEGYSTPVIGRYFGGRDHTSILHGLWKWREADLPPKG
jgi:chromosomal replication initiation ATPase DnaA